MTVRSEEFYAVLLSLEETSDALRIAVHDPHIRNRDSLLQADLRSKVVTAKNAITAARQECEQVLFEGDDLRLARIRQAHGLNKPKS